MRLIPGAVTVELGSRQIRASALVEHDDFWWARARRRRSTAR
jgi:hypothetical protein